MVLISNLQYGAFDVDILKIISYRKELQVTEIMPYKEKFQYKKRKLKRGDWVICNCCANKGFYRAALFFKICKINGRKFASGPILLLRPDWRGGKFTREDNRSHDEKCRAGQFDCFASHEKRNLKIMAKKNEIAKKSYVDNEGDEKRSAHVAATTIRFTFSDGTVTDILPSDLPENIVSCATLHGLSQKLGDSYAGAESVSDARESFDTMFERLQGGEWVAEKKAGGPRTSILVDAIAELLVEAGKPVDDEKRKAIAEKVKTKEGRDGAMANAAIAARYEKKRADRAAEKAAKAAADADGVTLDEF